MTTEFDDDLLRIFLRGTRSEPLRTLQDLDGWLHLFTFSISRDRPVYSDGWTHDLRPESRLYKRWFDLPDTKKRGWAIIFRIFDPQEPGTKNFESIPGWVPPEREADADRWIRRLNDEIHARLTAAAKEPAPRRPLVPLVFQEFEGDTLRFAPRLADSRGLRPRENKAKVVEYLRGGPQMAYSMRGTSDRFDPTRTVELSIVTDGRFSWPIGLADYVERYDVNLSPEFEGHLRGTGCWMPKNIDTKSLRLTMIVEPTIDDLASYAGELVDAERFEEAEAAYRRVLDASPTHGRALLELGTMYALRQRTDDAVEMFTRLITADPTSAPAWFGRAVVGGAQREHAKHDLDAAASLGHPGAASLLVEPSR
jgi:tetratricopeptide (TPR) repeat protein